MKGIFYALTSPDFYLFEALGNLLPDSEKPPRRKGTLSSMLKKPRTVFSTLQKRILQVCAVMMMMGGIILAIDQFVVRKDEPSTQEQLATLEEGLGLAQRNDDASKSALRDALAGFEPLTGPIGELGADPHPRRGRRPTLAL
jgi:hypothetical protein